MARWGCQVITEELMEIDLDLPLVEEILGSFRSQMGVDYQGYRNHVYRVINLCCSLGDFGELEKQKIQIAACFHDIGIWTGATLDYLPPSEEAVSLYLASLGKEAWAPEIVAMVEMHHRIRSCEASDFSLVEPFRRADIADFSLGLVRMGLDPKLISLLKKHFPNNGFHLLLAKLGFGWFLRNPLNPLPMFRK
jgi:hypothetical protein